MDSDSITNVAANSRYELPIDGHTAFAEYRIEGDVVTFTHTVVPKELEGRGVASRLIAYALNDVKARGLKVVPRCPFVAAYVKKHPEWEAILA